MRRRILGDLRLQQLELAALELGEVEQLVDRDVLLDRRERHARGADDLVHAEVPEELLVAGVVDARDRARHVEVVLGHLADDEVVLVVAGDRGDDRGPVGAGLGQVLALAAVAVAATMLPTSSAICSARAPSFSMSTSSWPAASSSLVR